MSADVTLSPVPPPPSQVVSERRTEPTWQRDLLFNALFLGGLWLLVFNHLRLEWTVNPLYSYGWFVPALAGYLFYERWLDRPAPAAGRPHWVWLVVPALLLVAYAPLRVVQEANPDWVKINWMITGIALAVTLAALWSWGRLRYLLHFGFPILFLWTTLPWPVQVEEDVTQSLMRLNTLMSAEFLTLCGMPAVPMGNLLYVNGNWLNVEEACSGIRSLQTAFMMSLFFGEFYRLAIWSRVLLLASSFALAFLMNVGRTMFLSFVGGADGGAGVDKWHDTAGNVVMVGCLIGLWLLALLFARKKKVVAAASADGAPRITPSFAPYPGAFALAVVAWLVVAEAGKEGWYRYHEAGMPPPRQWSVEMPREAPEFRDQDLGERALALLKYNHGESASWQTPAGHQMGLYYLRWEPGRVSKFLSGSHYPTVCLPATGLELERELGVVELQVEDMDLPFTAFLFRRGEQLTYIFHTILEDQRAPNGERIDYRQVKGSERIDSVLAGNRNLGQRVIGASVVGPASLDEATEVLLQELVRIVRMADLPENQ